MQKFITLLQSITIIFFPAYIFRFHTLVPTTLLEIFLLITVFVTFADFLKSGLKWHKLKTKYDLLIIFFLIAVSISVFKSPDLIGGLGILRAYFFEPVLFFYCLIYQIRKSGNNYVIFSLIISGFWLSAFGFLQKLTGAYSLAPHEIAQGRISAVYNSANALALYLGPIAILVFGKIFKAKKNIRLLYCLLFLLFTVVIYWTKSRGGMIAEIAAIMIALYAFFALKNQLLKKIWYVVPLICIMFISAFFYNLYQTYSKPVFYGAEHNLEDTLQIRYYMWIGTINMLKDHPIFGAGLNGFKTLYTNQYRLPEYQEEFQYPHNLLLTLWAETGILGLFVFLLIIVKSFGLLLRNLSTSKNKALGVSLVAILSYWIFHGMVDVPYFKNDLSVQFWTILALVQTASFRKGRS